MKRCVIFALLGVLCGCEKASLAERRHAALRDVSQPILIAFALPHTSSRALLLNGAQMALGDINQAGGVLGRPLRMFVKDDVGSLSVGRQVAQEIADDPRVAAVVGHVDSYVALSTAQIYERAGLLMVTPGAGDERLMAQNNPLIIRTIQGNRDQGSQLARYAVSRHYRRVAIYYTKHDDGIDLANYFEQAANAAGIAIVDRRSYAVGAAEHSTVVSDWASFLDVDAILLIGSVADAAKIVREARAGGMNTPIFCGMGLDGPAFLAAGGDQLDGVTLFAAFNPASTVAAVTDFTQRYRAQYGVAPESFAAEGYDTVHLLARAMRVAHSTDPVAVAGAFRATRDWHGVAGSYTFAQDGSLTAKPLVRVAIHEGRFDYRPAP